MTPLDHDAHTRHIAERVNTLLGRTDCYAEQTGGWIYCVFIPNANGSHWIFGMANKTWGGSLLLKDGDWPGPELERNLNTNILSASPDIDAIARAIVQALDQQ